MLPMRYQGPARALPAARMSRFLDQFFADDFFGPGWTTLARPNSAPLDIRDAGDAFEVELSLPGVKPEHIQVQVHDGVLSVQARHEADEQGERDGYLHREISRGSVRRAVQLPAKVDADRAEASYEHGVLRLRLPKVEAAKPHTIEVKGA